MTETHTPLRLNAGDETRIMEDRPDGVCLPVCDVKCGGMSGRTVKEGEALATRIVQAVNSHHDLIEALRAATDALERLYLKAVVGTDAERHAALEGAFTAMENGRAILTKEAGR